LPRGPFGLRKGEPFFDLAKQSLRSTGDDGRKVFGPTEDLGPATRVDSQTRSAREDSKQALGHERGLAVALGQRRVRDSAADLSPPVAIGARVVSPKLEFVRHRTSACDGLANLSGNAVPRDQVAVQEQLDADVSDRSGWPLPKSARTQINTSRLHQLHKDRRPVKGVVAEVMKSDSLSQRACTPRPSQAQARHAREIGSHGADQPKWVLTAL
jgi:hypothetical protein